MTLREIGGIVGIKVDRAHRWVKLGMPTTSREEILAWIRVHKTAKAKELGLIQPAKIRRVRGKKKRTRAEDDNRALLGRVQRIELQCVALVDAALKEGSAKAVVEAIKAHSTAVGNLLSARRAVREDRLASGELVESAKVHAAMARLNGGMMVLLRAMPRALAVRVMPTDPVHAEGILREWADSFLRRLHDANSDDGRPDQKSGGILAPDVAATAAADGNGVVQSEPRTGPEANPGPGFVLPGEPALPAGDPGILRGPERGLSGGVLREPVGEVDEHHGRGGVDDLQCADAYPLGPAERDPGPVI